MHVLGKSQKCYSVCIWYLEGNAMDLRSTWSRPGAASVHANAGFKSIHLAILLMYETDAIKFVTLI